MIDLETAYRKFLDERKPSKKEESGQELIRAIFGMAAIAGDDCGAGNPAGSRL